MAYSTGFLVLIMATFFMGLATCRSPLGSPSPLNSISSPTPSPLAHHISSPSPSPAPLSSKVNPPSPSAFVHAPTVASPIASPPSPISLSPSSNVAPAPEPATNAAAMLNFGSVAAAGVIFAGFAFLA